jgi:mRNA-degrading endonuclease RelE of RelBE toxin-antitoxin system
MGKRDLATFEEVHKKISALLLNPDSGKPLRKMMKGKRMMHIGSYVLLYEINQSNNIVTFLTFCHHDYAYE